MLSSSHDFHMSRFDQQVRYKYIYKRLFVQEEILVTGINQEMEKIVQMTHADELQRNRNRVIEITAFVERCYKEIEHAEDM